MRGRVFVCHASEDATAATGIVASLEARGIGCWIAPRNIAPGQNYTESILAALAATPLLILVFSDATNRSPHVQRELERATDTATPILPVRVAAGEPGPTLRYFIGTAQWLDAVDRPPHTWHPTLVQAATTLLGAPPSPRAVPTNPLDPVRSRPTGAAIAVAIVAVIAALAFVLTQGDGGGDGDAVDAQGLTSDERAIVNKLRGIDRDLCTPSAIDEDHVAGVVAAVRCEVRELDAVIYVGAFESEEAQIAAWDARALEDPRGDSCPDGDYERVVDHPEGDGRIHLRCSDPDATGVATIDWADTHHDLNLSVSGPSGALGDLFDDLADTLCCAPGN